MTDEDWARIARVIKKCVRVEDRGNGQGLPDMPSAEWMRRKIAIALADEFLLHGEPTERFLLATGI